jgi:hypothetical protein
MTMVFYCVCFLVSSLFSQTAWTSEHTTSQNRATATMVDIFEFVLYLAENLPLLVALSLGAVFFVRKNLRIWTALAVPLALLVCVSGVVIQSHYGTDYGEHHNYDPSLPSVRVALETYIETGVGDANEIIESGTSRPCLFATADCF